jgi:hypothetical protein
MVRGQTITAFLPDSPISHALREIWQDAWASVHEKTAVK